MIRRVIKTKSSLPDDQAATKLIYMAMMNAKKKWTMPVYRWRAALQQFAIHFEGRLDF